MTTKRLFFVSQFCLVACLACASNAFAWDCKDGKTVRLPGQKVVIQTGDPILSHRDRAATRGAPTVGTLYMPMQMQMFGIGVATGSESRGFDDSITRALESEHHTMKAAAARAAFEAEVKHKQALLAKLSAGSKLESTAALEESITKINARLDEMNKRLNSVEQLLVIHDNYIRKSLGAPVVPEAIGSPQTKSETREIGNHIIKIVVDKQDVRFIAIAKESTLGATFGTHKLVVAKDSVTFDDKEQLKYMCMPEPTTEKKCNVVVTFIEDKLTVTVNDKKIFDGPPIK
jgi:hypothetical protein